MFHASVTPAPEPTGRGPLRRRLITAVLTGLTAVGLVVISPASPARSTAGQCSNGANGFVDIHDDLRGIDARTTYNPRWIGQRGGLGVYVRLYHGTVAGADRGWAMIQGPTRPGDWVWMDVSLNGGKSVWVQCGPFSVDAPGLTKTSAAKASSSSSSVRFRACARMVGTPASTARCTSWW